MCRGRNKTWIVNGSPDLQPGFLSPGLLLILGTIVPLSLSGEAVSDTPRLAASHVRFQVGHLDNSINNVIVGIRVTEILLNFSKTHSGNRCMTLIAGVAGDEGHRARYAGTVLLIRRSEVLHHLRCGAGRHPIVSGLKRSVA